MAFLRPLKTLSVPIQGRSIGASASARTIMRLQGTSSNAHVKTSNSDGSSYVADVVFPAHESACSWLASQPIDDFKAAFERDGFIQVDNLLSEDLLETYSALYDRFLTGDIDTRRHRHDLGAYKDKQNESSENVVQIMWPSDYVRALAQGPLHARINLLSRTLLGDDIAFDFDMLIAKAAYTNTEVPWHQDEAYWLDMPDKRAVSCWLALDDAYEENGCMWFAPGSHKTALVEHHRVNEQHALRAVEDPTSIVSAPLKPGACTLHHGRTLHHTRGNTTSSTRRAYIVNFRPEAMIRLSRDAGFDHGRQGLDG